MLSLLETLLTLGACASTTFALGPWQHFVTEPTMRSSIFNITVNTSPNLLATGYIFITTYVSDFSVGSFGPQIYDMNGMLIWNGNDSAYVRAMDAHVCDYLGNKGQHICMNDAAPTEQAGHSAGVIRFFDDTYTQVGSDHGAAGNLRGPDIHELNVPAHDDGRTLLQDIYEIKSMDLRPFLGPEDGYVLDACFQEIDLRTKGVNFQWCALDHIPVWDTYLYLHVPLAPGKNTSMPIAGNGSWAAPWDFFHINAVGKNLEGDYIISGRHLDTVFKIAGYGNNLGKEAGEIIWRLGGKNNDFEMLGNFNFSRQHTVRFLSTGKSESTITLFNNAFDGWFYTSKWSDGQLISINNETMQARLVTSYAPPEAQRVRSFSQGSMQVLGNGNVFMGWGNRAYVSEHTADGEPIYWAHFSGAVESFRAWKFPWIGHPKTKPKLISYAYDVNSPLYAYVSWNGATEVTSWAVYYSDSTRYGPWRYAGSVNKDNFETRLNVTQLIGNHPRRFHPYVYAAALDKHGKVLATSAVRETFVPHEDLKKGCNETMCRRNWYDYQEIDSEAADLPRSHTIAIWIVALLITAVELAQYVCEDFGLERLMTDGSCRRMRRKRSPCGPRSRRRKFRDDEENLDEKYFRHPGVRHSKTRPALNTVETNRRAEVESPASDSGVEM